MSAQPDGYDGMDAVAGAAECNDDECVDCHSVYGFDDYVDEGAEDSTPSSSASAHTEITTTAVRKLHYADLTPLQCRSDGGGGGSSGGSTTGRGQASTAPVTTTTSSSSAEEQQSGASMKMFGIGNGSRRIGLGAMEGGTKVRSTQYATLKYSEVNM